MMNDSKKHQITIAHTLFNNRTEAADQLLSKLPTEKFDVDDWIIVAISAGGVVVANQLAKKLKTSFDFLFTERVTAPLNEGCDIASVSETEEIVIHKALVDAFDIKLDYVYGEAHRKYEENIISYIYKYRKGQPIKSLENKRVLFVDEGIDSGLTLMASIKTALTQNAKSISVATPVMPKSLLKEFGSMLDDIYFVHAIEDFVSIDFYYEDIEEPSIDDIEKLLKSITY